MGKDLRILSEVNNAQTKEQITEVDFGSDFTLSSDWSAKFQTYDMLSYYQDIETFGIETTWENICKYLLSGDGFDNVFFKMTGLGNLYEVGLAFQDKQYKKENGIYYTPNDAAEVMAAWLKKIDGYNVCDVACGTGELILTYLRLLGEDEARKLISEGRIYLYDSDKTALAVCKTSLLIKYGKQYAKSIHAICCDFLNKNVTLPNNCKVISNPPYAAFSSIPSCWERTQVQIQTKELYCCFMEKIITQSDASVTVTPFGFVGGKNYYSLRKLMNDRSGFIVCFDNIPGSIFCGKKLGVFNSNKSNSVRAAITVVDGKQSKGFRVSPLIRFKNEERKRILNAEVLENTIPLKSQIITEENPVYIKCHKELQEVYDAWVNKSTQTLNDLISSDKPDYVMYVPNTCRYFTSASAYELKRKGVIQLSFNDKSVYDFVYCLINSSFAYWWWRIFDGGITYSPVLLKKLPIFYDLTDGADREFFSRVCAEMTGKEKQYIVTKLNAGSVQENIKFPTEFGNKINQRLLKILGFDNLNAEIFNALHKNSFFGGL